MSLSCPYCAASFATKDRRDRHVLTHSKIKPFSCTVCQVGFNRKDHLQRHYSLLHKDLPPSDEPGQSPPWKHRTQTACSHCAHAKTKCDKQHPCSRCIKKGLDCRRRKSQNGPQLADASIAISPWNDGNIATMTDDTSLFDIGGILSPLDQSFTMNDLSADFSFLAHAGSFASDPEKDIGSIDRSINFLPMDKDLSRDLSLFKETFASSQDLSRATNIERPHTESETSADSVWPHIASDSSSINADSASSTQASSPRSRNISALTDLTQASGFDTLDVACIMYKDDCQHDSIVSAGSILSPVMLTMVMRDRLVEFLRRVSEQEVFPIFSHSKQVTRHFLPSLKVLNYHLCHHLAKTHTTSFVQASLIQAFTYSSEEDARRLKLEWPGARWGRWRTARARG